MAGGAIGVLRILIMLWASRFDCSDVMRDAMTRKTKLIDSAKSQQSWMRRAMRSVTRYATFSFYGRMFVGKRPLLISMTLDAGRIRADS
jgi:hypothetical protein